MECITPQNRQQITFGSIDEKIGTENLARFVDAFVEHLELEKLKFIVELLKPELNTLS